MLNSIPYSLILPSSKMREDIHPPPSQGQCLIMEVWVLYSKLQNVKDNDTAYLHCLTFIIRILYTKLQQNQKIILLRIYLYHNI